MRQIFPVTGPDLEVVSAVTSGPLPASVEQLAKLYGNGQLQANADHPRLRANMISSADGAAYLGGRSGPLGGQADRMLFRLLRSIADVILVGAGTARAERYGPAQASQVWPALRAGRPPTPPIAVVSNSLNLDACARLLTDAPDYARTMIFTTAAASADRVAAFSEHASVVACGHRQVDMRAAITVLSDLGYRHILVEGGPHLLGELVEANLLDELCLTTSPVLAGGPAGRIVAAQLAGCRSEAAARLTLAHVLADHDFLFSRYVRSAD